MKLLPSRTLSIATLTVVLCSNLSFAQSASTPPKASSEAALKMPEIGGALKWEARLSGEYFRFTRQSEFLGQETIASKVSEKLTGDIFGVGLAFNQAGKGAPHSFELFLRKGDLSAHPSYTNALGNKVRTDVKVTREDYELGGRYKLGSGMFSLRYGIFQQKEDLENVLPANLNAAWVSTTIGLDPKNARRYVRSLKSTGAYAGVGWVPFGEKKFEGGSSLGLRLDADLRYGSLDSNTVVFTGTGSEAKDVFGVPHRMTFYVRSNSEKQAGVFAEAGYKGEYNFTQGGGVKGYDYGYFVRLGLEIRW